MTSRKKSDHTKALKNSPKSLLKLSARDDNAFAVRKFLDLVQHFSYSTGSDPRPRGLTNFSFFCGAGFSKSWDSRAPIGSELFTLKADLIERVADTSALYRMFGLDALDEISPNQLRQIIYQMDMYERYPEVRPRYVDEQNIPIFRGALRAAVVDRYDKIAKLNYFNDEFQKFGLEGQTEDQGSIIKLFRFLHDKIDGSQSLVEGIRTHFITTNYDYVIETILDNIIGEDDSLFLYNYRGFTPDSVVNQPNLAPLHEHWLVQHLIKINGGFEILRRGDKYVLDYSRRPATQVMADPPVLMLASREQDYTDPYFRTIFPKAVRLLRETTVLFLVGYSLPEDDALIRFIIRQFAEEAEDARGKVVFYIGPGDTLTKRTALKAVFPFMDDMGVPNLIAYNGGFNEFARDCIAKINAATKRDASRYSVESDDRDDG